MNIAQYFKKFHGNLSLDRVADVLARQAKRRVASKVEIESLDHASRLIQEHREEISVLEKSLECVQAKKDEFCAATERLDALMMEKRDELIASAREGWEPDYRNIDAELTQVRDVLAQYADEQVNVPAAIASIESTLSEAKSKASAVLLAAQMFVSNHFRDEYNKAHRVYIDFINSKDFIEKIENMRVMLWLQRTYEDRHRANNSIDSDEYQQLHQDIEKYLEGIKRAGGAGVLNQDRTNAAYRTHAKHLENLGIISPDRNSDPCPNPVEVHMAKHIQRDIEKIEANNDSVNADH